MRPVYDSRTGSQQTWKRFKELKQVNIPFEDYLKILHTFGELLMVHLLETGDRVRLPWGLGYFGVNKKKRKRIVIDVAGKKGFNLPVDWKTSKEVGKIVYHMNFHTDGYTYHWAWFPASSKIKGAHIWKVEPLRVFSRTLAAYLKKPDSPYKNLYKEWLKRK